MKARKLGPEVTVLIVYTDLSASLEPEGTELREVCSVRVNSFHRHFLNR